ncbi:MAG: hypothetical protein Q8M16_16045 [Pirellulaceae bacterium]|nr:hypothetical protein [Pirellulaceae bacterium]
MIISSEVREHWTHYLQGQMTADEHEALGRRLVAEPDLASALAADSRVHQLLLDHYSTKPELIAVLSSLPERSFGRLNDAQFVERCLEAVGQATPLGMASGAKGPQQTETCDPAKITANLGGPPLFDLDDGITFVEPSAIPPVAVEPPPVCQSDTASPAPTRNSVSRWASKVALAAAVMLMAVGTWWYADAQRLMGGANDWAATVLTGEPSLQKPPVEDLRAGAGANAADLDRLGNPNPVGLEDVANADDLPRQPMVGDAAVEVDPLLAEDQVPEPKPEPNRFPQVIRGAPEEEPNFIKDAGEEILAGPLHTKLAVGQLVAGRDALWEAEPEAWGIQPERNGRMADRDARFVRLTRGEAQLVLNNGLKVGLQAPAAFQFVSPTKLRLIDGMFLVEPSAAGAPLDWTIATDCFDVAPSTPARFFVTTSAEFGTGVEVLDGEARLMPQSGLGEPVLLNRDGYFGGHFLPAADATSAKPGAAALAHRDGSFSGRIVAFRAPLQISSSEVFGATLQTIVQRMREAPVDFERDWRNVLERLDQLKANKRNRPGLRHEVRFSGDLLPAFPELQADLGRGIPLPKGPFDMDQIRQFAGQLNINGQLINLDNLGELRKIQQDLANDLNQLRQQQEQMQRNRNRRNAMDPDLMAQQMMIQQMQQIEMILKMAQGFQGQLPGQLPGQVLGEGGAVAPTEPVVASFTTLITPEGQQDRAAMVDQLQRTLEESLEDETQRAHRLDSLRRKLHQQ